MTCDLTLTNQEGETIPIRLEVTVNRYLTRRTSLDGTVYFNDKEFRLFSANTMVERHPLDEFIGKLRGEVSWNIGRDKSNPGTLDNIMYLYAELDRENKIVQLTVSGGGQNDTWILDRERLNESFSQL